MKTCPQCGAAHPAADARFCAQCGTPLPSPQQPQAPPPVYGGQIPPQQPWNPPPQQPQAPPPVYGGQFPPQQPWNQPPRKTGSKVGLWIGLGVGLLIVGVVGVMLLLPDDEPADGPTPSSNQAAQTNEPAQTSQSAETKQQTPPPPQEQKQPPAQQPANDISVRQIAQGKLDVSFQAFDWHSQGMLSLASGDGTNVQLDLFDYVNGAFQPAFQMYYPMGALNDVAFGDLFNDGTNRAILIAEQGLLLVDPNGESTTVETTDVQRVYVGDWDGDGQQETAIFLLSDNKPVAIVSRFYTDKETVRVGTWEVTEFPDWPAQTFLSSNKRRLLLGVNEVDSNNKEVVLYTIDPTKGLERNRAQKVSSPWSSPLVGAAAAVLGGKPTLVLSYQGSPSYLEFFDITDAGFTSRGKLVLLDDEEYFPIIGAYSGTNLELLVMTAQGKWMLFGF